MKLYFSKETIIYIEYDTIFLILHYVTFVIILLFFL